VTGSATDRYRFRTTPLRNVALTGPYGHDGAFPSLRQFIDHYSEAEAKLRQFDVGTVEPLLRGTLVANADAVVATMDGRLNGLVLSGDVVDQLTTFMEALTDPAARHLDRLIPARCRAGCRSKAAEGGGRSRAASGRPAGHQLSPHSIGGMSWADSELPPDRPRPGSVQPARSTTPATRAPMMGSVTNQGPSRASR